MSYVVRGAFQPSAFQNNAFQTRWAYRNIGTGEGGPAGVFSTEPEIPGWRVALQKARTRAAILREDQELLEMMPILMRIF